MSALWWFLIGLGMMVLELALPGFIVIFFGIGAWITAAVTALNLTTTLNGQLLVFLTTSVASVLVLRRWLQGTLKGRVTRQTVSETKLDDFVGHKAKVTVALSPEATEGRVEFRGTEWTATARKPISVGTTVRILAKDNLTLLVEPVSPEEKS
jgi:membrane protein implicated in regulation of membrane protease activity